MNFSQVALTRLNGLDIRSWAHSRKVWEPRARRGPRLTAAEAAAASQLRGYAPGPRLGPQEGGYGIGPRQFAARAHPEDDMACPPPSPPEQTPALDQWRRHVPKLAPKRCTAGQSPCPPGGPERPRPPSACPPRRRPGRVAQQRSGSVWVHGGAVRPAARSAQLRSRTRLLRSAARRAASSSASRRAARLPRPDLAATPPGRGRPLPAGGPTEGTATSGETVSREV